MKDNRCDIFVDKNGVKNVYVNIKKINEKAIIPKYHNDGDAGFDFHAIIDNDFGSVDIEPKSQYVVKTGISVAIPDGFEIQIRPRSGLAFKNQITVTNSPGTIDSCFRGEIMIILYNLSNNIFTIKHGDKIAQGVLSNVPHAVFVEVDDLSETSRGSRGFGSTGIR